MSKYLLLLEDHLFVETGIGGRLLFGSVAYALWICLMLILDRIGLPIQLAFVFSILFCLFGIALVGILVRTMRINAFYVLNRHVRAWHASLAMAAFACAICTPAQMQGGAWSLPAQATALLVGFIVFAMITAPLLRQTGAITPCDVIMARYPHGAMRAMIVLSFGAASLLIGAAGFELALDWLSVLINMERAHLAMIIAALILLCFAAGGQRAVMWIGFTLCVMISAPLFLPLAFHETHIASLPLPIIGESALWLKASQLMQGWSHDASTDWHWPALILLACGISALMPLIIPILSTVDARKSRRAALGAGLVSFIMVSGFALSLAQASLIFASQTRDRPVHALPAAVYQASANHLISICGQYPASAGLAVAACNRETPRTILRDNDVIPSPPALMMALPAFTPALFALSSILYAALIALCVYLSANGLMCFASVLGQDAIAKQATDYALTSQRLAITRAIFAVALILTAVLLSSYHINASLFMAASCAITASSFLPLCLLACLWRIDIRDGLCAICTSFIIMTAYCYMHSIPSSWDEWGVVAGLASAGAFIIGFVLGFAHKNLNPVDRKAFVYAVLKGHAEVYNRDVEA
jgi:cation/acetate symporter